jgi:hypothetical protein
MRRNLRRNFWHRMPDDGVDVELCSFVEKDQVEFGQNDKKFKGRKFEER